MKTSVIIKFIMNTAHRKREITVYLREKRIEKKLLMGDDNQTELAASENVSQPRISQHIKAIYERWKRDDPKEIEELKKLRIKELLWGRKEAALAYIRSCESTTETITVSKPEECKKCGSTGKIKEKECKVCKGTGYRVVDTETSRTRGNAGDSTCLAEARKCTVEMAKIQGLYPDRKAETVNVHHTGKLLHQHLLDDDPSNPYRNAPHGLIVDANNALFLLNESVKEENGKVIEGEVVEP